MVPLEVATLNFEWDPDKAEQNLTKHGISFVDAAFVFADPLNITLFDHQHSEFEERWITIGEVRPDLIVVVHSYPRAPDESTVRMISARLATRAERLYYEEGTV